MSFKIQSFSSTVGQSMGDDVEMRWVYKTTDSCNDVYLSENGFLNGYFSEVSSLINEGNIISVSHTSIANTNSDELSTEETPVDEVEYIVVYSGKPVDDEVVFVYPVQKGERLFVRHMNDSSTWTKAQSFSFPNDVLIKKLGFILTYPLEEDYSVVFKRPSGTVMKTTTINQANGGVGAFTAVDVNERRKDFSFEPSHTSSIKSDVIVFAVVTDPPAKNVIEPYFEFAMPAIFDEHSVGLGGTPNSGGLITQIIENPQEITDPPMPYPVKFYKRPPNGNVSGDDDIFLFEYMPMVDVGVNGRKIVDIPGGSIAINDGDSLLVKYNTFGTNYGKDVFRFTIYR